MNLWVAVCLVLAVIDLHCLQFGVRADEICCEDNVKQVRPKTSPNELFPHKSVTIPVKVHCDGATRAIRKSEPGVEETRIVSDVREKQKMRNEARRSTIAQSEKRSRMEEGAATAAATASMKSKSRPSAMAADCEQCEIQIKANGDGIFLRCRKCHPTDADGLRFPNTSPNKVVHLP